MQVTFGQTINLNIAQAYHNLLLTQNMTAIFGSDPSFIVRSVYKCFPSRVACSLDLLAKICPPKHAATFVLMLPHVYECLRYTMICVHAKIHACATLPCVHAELDRVRNGRIKQHSLHPGAHFDSAATLKLPPAAPASSLP